MYAISWTLLLLQLTVSVVNNILREKNAAQWQEIIALFPTQASSMLTTIDTYGEMQAGQLEPGSNTTYTYDQVGEFVWFREDLLLTDWITFLQYLGISLAFSYRKH